MEGLHWMCFNCTDFIVPWRTRASCWSRGRRGPIIVIINIIMVMICLFFWFGSNLGEMLPWNRKMYNPKVTWKLKKQRLICSRLGFWRYSKKLYTLIWNIIQKPGEAGHQTHHLWGFCCFVFLYLIFFPWKLNFIIICFCLNEVFIVFNC